MLSLFLQQETKKTNMRLKLLTLSVIISLLGSLTEASAQSESNALFDYDFGYTGDFMSNLRGGIKTGGAYLGMITLQLSLNTEDKGWWKGGEFAVMGSSTHGDEPSANLIGDYQVASNIEAGNHTYIQELWFKQQFGKTSIKVGLQDLNAEMAFSNNSQNLINSSFGIHSTISNNVPSPIFPLTALGITIGWDISDNIYWQTALYDGKTHDFENNPYNTHWKLGTDDGYIAISEIQYNANIFGSLKNSYKIGYYYHNHDDFRPDETSPNYGFYAVIDQELTSWSNNRSIGGFIQLGVSSKKKNNLYNYIGCGLQATGVCEKRADDILTIGVARSSFDKGIANNETTIELAYAAQLTPQIAIQPDLQYIVNPAGTETVLDDAFVATLRLSITY